MALGSNVSTPTTKRSLMWTGTALATSNTANITTTCVPSYKMITQLVAYAKDHYIKPLMSGGKEYYVLLVKPGTLAALSELRGRPLAADHPLLLPPGEEVRLAAAAVPSDGIDQAIAWARNWWALP